MLYYRHLILSLTLTVSGCAPAYAQTIFWTRSTPGIVRDVWVYGRDLWSGPEKVAQSSTITLKSATGEHTIKVDHLHGANDQDGNRALPYLQRFRISPTIPAGENTLTFTRNDGKQTTSTVTLPAPDERTVYMVPGELKELSATLILPKLPPGEWNDLGGKIISPSANFPANKPLLYIESGAWVRNAVVWLPEGSSPNRAIAFPGTTKGCRLEAVKVINQDKGEYGIELRGAEDAFFHCVDVVSSRCVDANPSDCPKRNTFVRCSFTSPRGSADGQVGRGTGGEEAFMLQCGWSNIDRGPTLSPQGAPLSRCVWFECSQRNTGITEGASEGLLIEAKKLCPVRATIIGQGAVIKVDDAYISAAKDYLKPGYSLWTNDGTQRWARICECNDPIVQGQAVRVKLDRVFSSTNISEVPAYVGNGLTESAILRCRFSQGRSGVWFWCANADCVVVGNECTDLDFGFLTLQRSNPPSDVAFSWGLVNKHNRFRRVGEEWKVMR